MFALLIAVATATALAYGDEPIIQCGLTPAVCPDGIAGIYLSLPDQKYEVCSAFLLAPDRLVSAAHCLPEKSGSEPRVFIYRKQGLPEERKVTRISQRKLDDRGMDIAEAVLDRPASTTPLRRALHGFRNGELVTAYSAKFEPSRKSFVIQRHNGKVLLKSLWIRDPGTADQSTAMLGDLSSLPGYSGSAVVDSRGEVVGALKGGTADAERSETEKRFLPFATQGLAVTAQMTNIRCLQAAPAGCQPLREFDAEATWQPYQEAIERAKAGLPLINGKARYLNRYLQVIEP